MDSPPLSNRNSANIRRSSSNESSPMILRRNPPRKNALTTVELSLVPKGKIQKKKIKSNQMNKKENGKSSLTTTMKNSLQISTIERSDTDTEKMDDDNQNSAQYDDSNDEQVQTRERLDSTASDKTEVTEDETCTKRTTRMTKEDVLSYFTLIDGKLKCNLCKDSHKVRLLLLFLSKCVTPVDRNIDTYHSEEFFFEN